MKKLALLFHLILVLFLTGTQLTFGQSFPVQVIPQALPPAPIYFSDYADESTISSPLRVQLILNDLQVASKEVRLKASFEGNGIAFESNTIVSGAPLLFLESGIPLNLTNIELAPYFKFENIIGISPNVYGRAIPEGSYRFCFEVFDAFSGNRISGRTCAGTVIFQNDPPILITPLNKATVEERNPQNIFFQWTPRHINVSNVEYELSIVEIWDNQIDPQAAFLSSPPIFQTTTPATTYLYGPADPQLLSDKNYAWRVQAKAKQGAEEIGFFKNEGFSTIFVFGNTGICDLPSGINHEVKGATNANIFWDDFSSEAAEFQVRYRETGGNKEWFYEKTTANLLTVWQLDAGTEYEYQIAKTCILNESEYSLVKTFTTHFFDSDDSIYECGISPDINVTNETPLASLNVGEKFTAGDFPVTLTVIDGANGYFTGEGYVTIPYLKSIKVAVEFTNVFINELRELKQGNVITLYDPSLSGIVDPWDVIDDIDDIINGGDAHILDEVDFDITGASVSEDGETLIITGTDENGNTVEHTVPYDETDSYQITGSNGVFDVGPDGAERMGDVADGGTPTNSNTDGLGSGDGTAEDPKVDTIADTDILVTYREDPNANYGYDAANGTYEEGKYTKVETASGGSFYPIHKAVLTDKSDTFFVDIDIKKEGITKEDLVFKTINGQEITAVNTSGNAYKITVKGFNGYRSEEALITYKDGEEKQVVVSSFFIHHLKALDQVNVTLVPVGGYAIANNTISQVTKLFASAGGNLNLIEGSTYNGDTSNLRYSESGLLSNYPEDFKNFHSNFKNSYSDYSSDQYYVFLFDQNVQPGQNLAGFMPRKLGSQFGYVFSSNISTTGIESKQSIDDVIAHELGHGIFLIGHPADDDVATDWLMDKGSGNQLAKRDWQAMGDEGIKLYLFDDDEDGESTGLNKRFRDYYFPKGLTENNQPYPFLTPSNKNILLPPDVSNVEFFYGYYGSDIQGNFEAFLNLTPGTLRGFTTEYKTYVADIEILGNGNAVLHGYKNIDNGKYYDWETHVKTFELDRFKDLKGSSFVIMLLPGKSTLNLVKVDPSHKNFDSTDRHQAGNGNPEPIKSILDFDLTYDSDSRIIQNDANELVYSAGSNISELKDASDWAWKNGTYSENQKNRLLLAKIAELRSVYPEIINKTTNGGAFNSWSNCAGKFGLGKYGTAGAFEAKLLEEYCDSYSGASELLPEIKYRSNGTVLPANKREFLIKFYNFLKTDLQEITSNTVSALERLQNEEEYAFTIDIKKLNTSITYASKEELTILDGEAISRILRRYSQNSSGNIPKDTFFKIFENLNEATEEVVYENLSIDEHTLFFNLFNRFKSYNGFVKTYVDFYTKLIENLGHPSERISAIRKAVTLRDPRFSDSTEQLASFLFNNITSGVNGKYVINDLQDNDYELFAKVWNIVKRERLFEFKNTDNEYATNFVLQITPFLSAAFGDPKQSLPVGVNEHLMLGTIDSSGVDYLNGDVTKIPIINISSVPYSPMLKPSFWLKRVKGKDGKTSKNKFKYESKLNTDQNPHVNIYFEVIDASIVGDTEVKIIDGKLKPFDYVIVQFLDDTRVGDYEFKRGGLMAVPAMYLAWADYLIDAEKNSVTSKLIINGVVVISAAATFVPSGGQSVTLASAIIAGTEISIAVASSTVDIMIYNGTIDKNNGDGINSKLAYVDMVLSIATFPQAIEGVISFTSKGKTIISKAPNFVTDLKAILKNGKEKIDIKIDRGKLVESLTNLKNQKSEDFKTKFNKLKDLLSLEELKVQNAPSSLKNIYQELLEASSAFYEVKFGKTNWRKVNGLTEKHDSFREKLMDWAQGTNSALNREARYGTPEKLRRTIIDLLDDEKALNIVSKDKALNLIDNFMSKYKDVEGALDYFDELTQSVQKFKGGLFGLEILDNLPISLKGKRLIGFESGIDDLGKARFDLKFVENGIEILVETKNYASSTPFSNSFYNQFRSYIKEINSLSQMKYFFRLNNGVTKANRVSKFKNMLSDNAEEIFKFNQGVFTGIEKLDGSGGTIKDWEDLKDFLKSPQLDENNPFFDFIEIY